MAVLSIVAPVFREEKNIPEFVSQVVSVLKDVTDDYEIIFAMDPSPDRTEEVILAQRERNERIKLLRFSRRFGQASAVLAGMQYASGDAVVVMDVDLQDPPALIPEMMARWRDGCDVVYAQRRSRAGETWIRRAVSSMGYKLIKKVADIDIPRNTGEFRLMSRRVVDEVNKLKESHGFLRGLVPFVGFKQVALPFDRPGRFAGKTNYNPLIGSIRIGMYGVFCFSNYMLTLVTKAGLVLVAGSAIAFLAWVCGRFWGFPPPVSHPLLLVLILLMGGFQLLAFGIVGHYVGLIYDEVKQRPKFIVDAAVGFGDSVRGKESQKPAGPSNGNDNPGLASVSRQPGGTG